MTPQKYPQNLHTPQNIQSSENPPKYWNSKFWPPPPSLVAKRTGGPKMKSLTSSQIWNFKHLFLIGTSHKNAFESEWLSGRMLDSRPRATGSNLTGVTVLWSMSKTHLSLLSTGSTQEDPSLLNWKIDDGTLRIKSNKQTIKVHASCY